MNDVLRLYLHKHVLIFFNNISIYFKNWNEHLSQMSNVLNILFINHLLVKNQSANSEYLGSGWKSTPQKFKLLLNAKTNNSKR